jgi:hypothetical protein
MWEMKCANRVLVGKIEGKIPLGRPRLRWEDNIKMTLKETGRDGDDSINLSQDREKGDGVLVNKI